MKRLGQKLFFPRDINKNLLQCRVKWIYWVWNCYKIWISVKKRSLYSDMFNLFYEPTYMFSIKYKGSTVDKFHGIWFKFLSTNFIVNA